MIPLIMRRLMHPVGCSINKCKSKDTYMLHRGKDRANPIHLCSGCIREITLEYIRVAGREKAAAVLADAIALLTDVKTAEGENTGTEYGFENGDSEKSVSSETASYAYGVVTAGEATDADSTNNLAAASARSKKAAKGTDVR